MAKKVFKLDQKLRDSDGNVFHVKKVRLPPSGRDQRAVGSYKLEGDLNLVSGGSYRKVILTVRASGSGLEATMILSPAGRSPSVDSARAILKGIVKSEGGALVPLLPEQPGVKAATVDLKSLMKQTVGRKRIKGDRGIYKVKGSFDRELTSLLESMGFEKFDSKFTNTATIRRLTNGTEHLEVAYLMFEDQTHLSKSPILPPRTASARRVASRYAANFAAKWDALSPRERIKLMMKDISMRGSEWKSLREDMSKTQFAQLSRLQQEAVPELFKMASTKVGSRLPSGKYRLTLEDRSGTHGEWKNISDGDIAKLVVLADQLFEASEGRANMRDLQGAVRKWKFPLDKFLRNPHYMDFKVHDDAKGVYWDWMHEDGWDGPYEWRS